MDGHDGHVLLVYRAWFGRGLCCSVFKSDWSWGWWSRGEHGYWLGFFLFVERGISDAVGVVDVRVGGGSSGVVGRHVVSVVGGVSSEQFCSSFILVEYFRGIPEVFLRDPRIFVCFIAFPSNKVLMTFGAASMFEDALHFVLFFAVD